MKTRTRIKGRIRGLCLLIAIGCLLTGCQLAKEEGGAAGDGKRGHEDRLVGVFVTTEYLGLFDFEGYMQDNLSGFSGGEILADDAGEEYQGRLYGELIKESLTDGESGRQVERERYSFPGVKGIAYYSFQVPGTEERESYFTSGSDEGLSDGHVGIHSSDEGNRVELEGTIYVPAGSGQTYYFNPMYQDAEGRIYVTSGSGMSSGGDEGEGGTFSQTMKGDYAVTENGRTVKDSVSVLISIRKMYPPEEIVILQMAEDSRLLSRAEYKPEEVPESIVPEEGAAYFIVETRKRDSGGQLLRTRMLYDRGEDYLEVFSCREDGICIKRQVLIEGTALSPAPL